MFNAKYIIAEDENGNLFNQQTEQQNFVNMNDQNNNYVHFKDFQELTQVVTQLQKKLDMYEQLLQNQQKQQQEEVKPINRKGGNVNESLK